MMFILWLVVAYFCGAFPWSVWLGLLIYHVDPRQEADRNPGAANAFRAAGWRLGVAILILDFLKAFIPVFIARWGLDFTSDQLFWIALMPTLGHAFSVFLRFRGGRGIDTWFGVWTAITLYEVPLVMGAGAIAGSLLFKKGEARTLMIPLVLLPYLLLRHVDAWMVWLALAQLLILSAKIAVFYLSPNQSAKS
jgi:glycerol-3-phosphate acyltransferase PlsY